MKTAATILVTLTALNALPCRADWPVWYGPGGNFSAKAGKTAIVDDLKDARKIWKSEFIPPAIAQSKRYGLATRYPHPTGGAASPIVCGGKVFQFYFLTSGDAVDEPHLKLIRAKHGKQAADATIPKWRISADDVLHCLDAETGKTLWKKVFPGEGLNWYDHKGTINNLTPCAFDGKVYFVGSTAVLHCLDAASGKELWRKEIPRWRQEMSKHKSKALARKVLAQFNRQNCRALTFASGVVVTPDTHSGGDRGIHGFDGKTGRHLWHVEKVVGGHVTPLQWTSRSAEFLIAANGAGEITCIEPRAGKVLWREDSAGYNVFQPVLDGDLLLVNLMGREAMKKQVADVAESAKGKNQSYGGRQGAAGQVGCYRLTPSGAKLAWKLPAEYGYPYNKAAAVVLDGIAYLRGGLGDKGLVIVEMAGGKILGEDPAEQNNTEAHAFGIGNRVFFERDSQHNHTDITMFDANPKKWRAIGKVWKPPHPHSTSYQTPISHPIVNGRIFIRGADGIYCYDLTKQ